MSIHKAYAELQKKRQPIDYKAKFPKDSYRVFCINPFEVCTQFGWYWKDETPEGLLRNIPMSDFHDKDRAVCFFWTPIHELENVISIMRKWGFCYETLFVMESERTYEAAYNRLDHLLVVVGATKNGEVPDVPYRISSTFLGGENPTHEFRKVIDKMYPEGNKIQFFPPEAPPEHWDVLQDQYRSLTG